MKVILQQDIKGTGKKGEIINASEGYARNFLIPKGLALPADAKNMNQYNQKLATEQHRKKLEKEAAEETAKKLNGQKVVITAKAGEQGKLFGSITAKEIAEVLIAQGYSVDKRNIQLAEPIRALGSTQVEIKVYSGISATITVSVEAQ